MATEAQLRRRIRDLENTLSDQQRQYQQMESRIREETQKQIRQAQKQIQDVYQRNLDETVEAYANRIRSFQEDMVKLGNKQIAQLEKQAADVRAKMRNTIRDMEHCSEELRQELEKLKAGHRRQEEAARTSAEEAYRQVQAVKEQVAKTPHGFFAPHSFEILTEHISDIPLQIRQKLYEAAASDAHCVTLDLQLLEAKVNQAFQEWLQAFEDYRNNLQNLMTQIQAFETVPLQTEAGTFRMNREELNFWSSGTYIPLVNKVKEASDRFCSMQMENVLDYLNEKAGTNRHSIYDSLLESRKWQDELTAIINCIISERLMSDQRYALADQLVAPFENVGYTVCEDGFLPFTAGEVSPDWYICSQAEDPMNTYLLRMELYQSTSVTVRILPHRENGLAVSNELIVTADLRSVVSQEAEQKLMQQYTSRISQILENQKKLQQAAGKTAAPLPNVNALYSYENPQQRLQLLEMRLNPRPSPDAQIRYLERKYH